MRTNFIFKARRGFFVYSLPVVCTAFLLSCNGATVIDLPSKTRMSLAPFPPQSSLYEGGEEKFANIEPSAGHGEIIAAQDKKLCPGALKSKSYGQDFLGYRWGDSHNQRLTFGARSSGVYNRPDTFFNLQYTIVFPVQKALPEKVCSKHSGVYGLMHDLAFR